MTIESATYINGLNASYPGAADARVEGDDHIRLIKTAVKASFPNVAGPVTPTHTVINNLAAGTFPTVPITGVTDLTTRGGVASFVWNSGHPGHKIEIDTTEATYTANVITSYSATTSVRDLILNVTTDASNSPSTSGGFYFKTQMLGVTASTVDQDGKYLFATSPWMTLPASQVVNINRTMAFALTSNTNLKIYVRGSDGTVRTANITLA